MAVKKADPKPMGRPSIYSDAIASEILDRIMDGESLRSICRDDHMPAKSTVLKWRSENRHFSDQYDKAKQEQADSLEDDILAIADMALDPADKRVRIDARKWIACKLKPRKYGDKVTQEVTGENGGPVKNALTIEFVRAIHDKD